MGKRGPKPRRSNVRFSSNVAYGIGLLTTDGCLSGDGRHIDLTSADIEQLENFKKCFNLHTKISYKKSTYSQKSCPHIQFSDVGLYKFLIQIGLTPAKSKTLGAVAVPDHFFFDFLRGHHDGDGCFYSYWDPRWKSSFMYYLSFVSASRQHVLWLQGTIGRLLNVKGRVTKSRSVYQLRYAKAESLKILQEMYRNKHHLCLKRKKLKIEKALRIVGEQLVCPGGGT